VDVVFVPASITGSSTASRPGSTELVSSTQDEIISKDLEVTVMPNPSNTYFTVIVNGDNTNSTNVRVFDPSGKVLEKHERIPAGQNLQIGSGWRSGFYFVEVIKGKQRKFIKVIKTN
ncbi:MAG TPA: T9SS type A sorting domain-containing protein, partial [Chitinophagaceae bacterium]|nr:T9SS type A sorting domain-containing protein [Chitinophagaceae bacterium]